MSTEKNEGKLPPHNDQFVLSTDLSWVFILPLLLLVSPKFKLHVFCYPPQNQIPWKASFLCCSENQYWESETYLTKCHFNQYP